MAETTGWVPEDNFPGVALAFGVGEFDIVGDDVDLFGVRAWKEGREDASNVGGHTAGFFARLVVCVYINVSVLGGARLPRDNNDGNTILLAPNVELFKSRIKLDV